MEWSFIIIGLSIIIITLARLLSSYTVVKTNFSADAKKPATVYYYLPESILKIRTSVKVAVIYNSDDNTVNASSRIIEQNFATTTEIIADTKDLLSLNYKPNVFMADDIKYVVNTKGLLETVNITTEDRTADIIAQLAEAPKVGLKLAEDAGRAANTIVKIKEFSADFAVKASTISSTPFPINWQIIIPNELGKDEFITVQGDFKISSPDLASNTPKLSELINGTNATANNVEIDGILTRPLKNIELKFESAGINNTLPLNVVIADNSKLIVIPVKRTAFVKRVNNIGIQDGVIFSNEIKKPSSVEGFVTIPTNIAKALVSIPAQLIQFKFDITKRFEEAKNVKPVDKSTQPVAQDPPKH